MEEPQRGEIWRAKFIHRAGTELLGEHPCLIVSANEYNEGCDRLTVVPLTTYKPGKEDKRSPWAVTITNMNDVELDPRNERYGDEKLGEWFDKGRGIPFKSIIDCAQPWTIFKHSPSDQYTDLRWDRRYGKLHERMMIRVDTSLQVLIGDIHYNGYLRYREGHVLTLNLPHTPYQRYLVVSSPAIDAIREQIRVKERVGYQERPLGQCTVVPLVSAEYYKDLFGEALVDVYPIGGKPDPTPELALCYEIYTIDWRSRGAVGGPVGRVYDRNADDVAERDMVDVREALWDYLDLPY